eukprot:g9738.t1
MPPYRGSGGRGSGGAGGTLLSMVTAVDSALEESFGEAAKGTDELAEGVGLADQSCLDKGVHDILAARVQELAATDAKLELQRRATISALKSMAAEINQRAARGPGDAGANEPPAEQMNLEYFVEMVQSKVSSAMERADERALESTEYKELMKKIMPADGNDEEDFDIVPAGGTQASLKCPCTSTTFVDPVKSKVCSHTYSRAAIANHIKIGSKGSGARCPVAGCSHKVALTDLVKDKDMERRLRIESNTRQTGPEQDAEEVDEEMPVGETCI